MLFAKVDKRPIIDVKLLQCNEIREGNAPSMDVADERLYPSHHFLYFPVRL